MGAAQGWLRVECARRAEPRVEFERVERALWLTNTTSSESSRAFCSSLESSRGLNSTRNLERGSSLDSKSRAGALLVLNSSYLVEIAQARLCSAQKRRSQAAMNDLCATNIYRT